MNSTSAIAAPPTEDSTLTVIHDNTGYNLNEAMSAIENIESRLFGPTPSREQAEVSPLGLFSQAERNRIAAGVIAERLRIISQRLGN